MLKKFFAETIGTFVLVFMGCGSAMFLGCATGGGHLAVALTFGLSIVAMAYVIGGVSGCHINPAVSFAMFLNKKITGKEFTGYVIAQLLGAVIAGATLFAFTKAGMGDATGGLGSNGIASVGNNMFLAIAVEIILTFIFIYTILGVTSDKSKSSVAGLVIGFTLAFVHIVGIPLTGTSVNPARSLGVAIFAGGSALANSWIFVVAPLAGAFFAFCVFKLVNKPTITEE